MSSRNYLLKTTQKQYFLRVTLEEMSQFKFLFFDHIVDLWNSLPVTIKITDQLSLFSNKVNEFFIDKFNPNNERFMFRVQVSISVYLISTWIIYLINKESSCSV